METGYFARRLIQLGAPLTSRDRDGETPLHTATVSRNELVIRLLVKAGADINVLDYRGLAPLHHACKDENTHIAQVLIRAGADLNQPNRPMGDTPLLMALRIGYRPMVAILLDAGVDVNRANASGDTPLAVAQGWPCVVEWLKL